MNYVIMNIFVLFAIALLLCYVPIIIRYKSKLYKWSNDIYEVGIGVNMSNSIFNSISNFNIGNYFIYFYIYLFIYLDLVIIIIIISYFIFTNSFIYICIISFIILSISYSLLIKST